MRQVEMERRLEDTVRLYAELRSLIRLVRVKERALMAALRRLGAAAPATADWPGLERAAGGSASGRAASKDAADSG